MRHHHVLFFWSLSPLVSFFKRDDYNLHCHHPFFSPTRFLIMPNSDWNPALTQLKHIVRQQRRTPRKKRKKMNWMLPCVQRSERNSCCSWGSIWKAWILKHSSPAGSLLSAFTACVVSKFTWGTEINVPFQKAFVFFYLFIYFLLNSLFRTSTLSEKNRQNPQQEFQKDEQHQSLRFCLHGAIFAMWMETREAHIHSNSS